MAGAIPVAIIGAQGRMGTATCQAVEAADGLQLVARVGSRDLLQDVTDAGAAVAVELTTPGTVFDNTAWLLDHGVHVVVGASGLDDRQLGQLAERTDRANCLVVPNFAIGAVLMMRLAEQVAAHLPEVEIIEAHHAGKADAPSGTALRTAARIADGRTRAASVPGPAGHPARGTVHGDVPIHSVRLPGLVASQAVLFGGEGQTLTIRHDSIDRRSFMPGVLLAVRGVAELPGLTVGLDAVL